MALKLCIILLLLAASVHGLEFEIEEASVEELQAALNSGRLTSRALVEFYIVRISKLNPILNAVIEVNPDAIELANEADFKRKKTQSCGLQGIPILIKDSIATADKLNTTAGSLALLGSKVPRDAGIITRLRRAGAIILGKANLSEWLNFRSSASNTSGWSARGGQTKDPYNLEADPCGSSSGSAVGAAANLASVTIGTETDGSILCPSGRNAVVGIKPTVGLTSRSGSVPISHTQDTIGPICRTVADAAEVLDAIVGPDKLDPATEDAAKYIPPGGYKQYLKHDGLSAKRLGILRYPFFQEVSPTEVADLDKLLLVAKSLGAVLVDNLMLPNVNEILSFKSEGVVTQTEFKEDLNKYLNNLLESPVRSLADIIQFNIQHADQELKLFGQEIFLLANNTNGTDTVAYNRALKREKFLTKHGVYHLFKTLKLDVLVAPTSSSISSPAAIAGYPAITVPAGWDFVGVPFGITFMGTKGSEPTLIEIAFAFEQATKVRRPPSIKTEQEVASALLHS